MLWTSEKLEKILHIGCFFYEKVRQLELLDFQAMGGVVQCFGIQCEFDIDHLNPLGLPTKGG